MLGKYATRIRRLSPAMKRQIVKRLGVKPSRRGLIYDLEVRDICSADVVLTLLRLESRESRRAAEYVMGKPITVCLPAVPRWPPAKVRRTRTNRDAIRFVVYLKQPNPRRPGSVANEKYALAEVGVSVAELYRRGVRKRDVRSWLRRKWIRFEER